MRQNFDELPNGYLEGINNGIKTVRAFCGNASTGNGAREEQLKRLREEIQTADAIVIGGGAGLSTSSEILPQSSAFGICIPEGFIHSRMRRHAGRGGPDISM